MVWYFQVDERNFVRVFCGTDLKSAPCSGVSVAGLCDSCAALCEHSRLPSSSCIQIVDVIKDMFSKWRVTASQHEVMNMNQTQSMYDAVFVSESPQAKLNEIFFASHVSKIGGNTMIPSSWSVDKTVQSLQQTNTLMMLQLQLSRKLGNWFAERVGNCLRRLNFESVIVVVVRTLLV